MENYTSVRYSQGSQQTSSKRPEFKQVRLDFGGGDGTKQIVPEKKKRTKTTNINMRFFNDEDDEFTLPKNISNNELIQYLKIELMNIENKMAQLTIRKGKILELIDGVVDDMSSKLDAMRYEHIEFNELSITQEALRRFGSNLLPEKADEYSNSIINLSTSNFDGVDYSLFPMADSDIKDEPFSEENLIAPFLRTTQIPGVTFTNNQLNNELKRLNNVEAMEITDLQDLGSQYGIKSSDQQVLRKCLKEIKEFYQNKKIPNEYLNGYNIEFGSIFLNNNINCNSHSNNGFH